MMHNDDIAGPHLAMCDREPCQYCGFYGAGYARRRPLPERPPPLGFVGSASW